MEEKEKGGSSMLLSQVIKVNEITEKPKERKPTEEDWDRVRTIIYNRLFYNGGDQLLLRYWRKEITEEEYDKKYEELFYDNLHLFMDIFS